MKSAFKEWAAVCSALGRGRSILVLRRGGVAEPDGAFRPGLGSFLLFPTQFHQSPDQLADWALEDLARAKKNCPPAGQAEIALCASAADAWPVRGPAELERLRGLHPWSDAAAREKLERGGESSLWAIPLRVAALPGPVRIPMSEAYAGCRSWIELERDVETGGAIPVLDDERFEAERSRIALALGR